VTKKLKTKVLESQVLRLTILVVAVLAVFVVLTILTHHAVPTKVWAPGEHWGHNLPHNRV